MSYVRPPVAFGAALTDRELNILALVSSGLSNGDIGKKLYLSENTVKAHLKRINVKIGANDRAHALVLAFSQGLLRLAHDGHAVSARLTGPCGCGLGPHDHHDLRCAIWVAQTVGPDTCDCHDVEARAALRSAREQAVERERAVAEWNRLTPMQRATRIDELAGLGA